MSFSERRDQDHFLWSVIGSMAAPINKLPINTSYVQYCKLTQSKKVTMHT